MTKTLTPLQKKNRELYPEIASFVDEAREVFGDVKFVRFSVLENPSGIDSSQDAVKAKQVFKAGPGLPVTCKVSGTNASDKRALSKQRLLEQMIADGLISLGAK